MTYSDQEMRGATLYAKLLAALVDGPPRTYMELAEFTGLHLRTCQRYVKALHDAKLVHVAGWEEDPLGRFSIAAFVFGRGRDAKRPVLSATEKKRRYRAGKKLKVASVFHLGGTGA